MIREARLGDLDDLERLERDCFPEPWNRRMIESELAAPNRVNLVWSEGARVAGYVLAMQIIDEIHVNKICTVAEERRRGVARELMRVISAVAVERGCELLSLEVRRSNTAARAFYESLGFTLEYERRNYYPSGEDALVMSRPVSRP